jgi:hypothetical protein
MKQYKFIFVVLSSDKLTIDNPYYGNEKRYNKFKILNKIIYDKFINDIKFFFIEYNNKLEENIIELNDYIYIKGDEMPLNPNTLLKTIQAIEYINNKYNYDYIIHTNLSSIWNIPVLLSLYDNIPRTNFFGGHLIFDYFITGTGILFSNDIIPLLINIKTDTNIFINNNDIAITAYMVNYNIPIFNLQNMLNYKWEQIINDNYANEYFDDILYFRIKNSSDEISSAISSAENSLKD